MSDWTDRRKALLRQFHAENMAFSLIAYEINRATNGNLSRNACIGKAGRMGLQARKKTPRPTGHDGALASGVINRIRAKQTKPAPPVVPAKPPQAKKFLGLPLLQLEYGQCRFPRGESPTLFCGQPKLEGSSYCPSCHAICYRPTRDYAPSQSKSVTETNTKRAHAFFRAMRGAA